MLVWLDLIYSIMKRAKIGMKKAARMRLASSPFGEDLPPLCSANFYHPIHNNDYTLFRTEVKEKSTTFFNPLTFVRT